MDFSACDQQGFVCDCCGVGFQSPLISVSFAEERTHFFREGHLPEVEISGAEMIATYCSEDCFSLSYRNLLAAVRIHDANPGIGPIEQCSCCGAAVDMTEFHLAWTFERCDCQWGSDLLFVQPREVLSLAIICTECTQKVVATDGILSDVLQSHLAWKAKRSPHRSSRV